MEKEPLYVSGAELVAALDRVSAIMKEEIRKEPELTYQVADGALNIFPTIAVVFTFDPESMRHTDTKICWEKRAAKAWNEDNGIKI